MKLNNKGTMLLEVIATSVILGILIAAGLSFLNYFTVSVARLQKKANATNTTLTNTINTAKTTTITNTTTVVNPAVEPGADERNFVSALNLCVAMKGTNGVWFAKRVESRTVEFFQNSPLCKSNSIGTLNATNNPTYDDTVTDTFWNVSGEGQTLRVLVRKLNLKK